MANCSELIVEDISLFKDGAEKVFGNANPLRIEIGCGKGKFITETAAQTKSCLNFHSTRLPTLDCALKTSPLTCTQAALRGM